MTKFASLLGRKPTWWPRRRQSSGCSGRAGQERARTRPGAVLSDRLAARRGKRGRPNLLIDAEHKITELDSIKTSLGRLVDPITRTLRAFEEAKNEKLSLQSVLNNTRIAYSKLREDLTSAEKKAATLDTECIRLREVLTVAQQTVTALEATKSEQSAELTARRGQITELQRIVQQQSTDLQATREESQHNTERAATADRKLAQLEAAVAAASQKFQLAEQERAAVQGLLDKALNDSAQLSRCLLDSDKALAATQVRLQKVETALAEAQSERIRLTTALEDANETQRKDAIAHSARFEALQARAQLSDKLLEESRQTLAARADEISAFDRRLTEATLTRGAIETKFGQIEARSRARRADQGARRGARHPGGTQCRADPRARHPRERLQSRAGEDPGAGRPGPADGRPDPRGARNHRAADRGAQGAAAARAARPLDGGRRTRGRPQGHRAAVARTLQHAIPAQRTAGDGAADAGAAGAERSLAVAAINMTPPGRPGGGFLC